MGLAVAVFLCCAAILPLSALANSSSTTPRPTCSPTPVGSPSSYEMIAAIDFHVFIEGLGRDFVLSYPREFGSIFRNFADELGIGLREYRDVPKRSLILALGERNLANASSSATLFVSEDSPLNNDQLWLNSSPLSISSSGGRRLIFDPSHNVISANNVQLLLSIQFAAIPSTAEPPGFTSSGSRLVEVVTDVQEKLRHAQDQSYPWTATVTLPILEASTAKLYELASQCSPTWATSRDGGLALNLHIDQHSVIYSPPQLYLRRSLAPRPSGVSASETPTQWAGVDTGPSPTPSKWSGGNNPFGGGGTIGKGMSGGQTAGVAIGTIAAVALVAGVTVAAASQFMAERRRRAAAAAARTSTSAATTGAVAQRRASPAAAAVAAEAASSSSSSSSSSFATGVDPSMSPNSSGSSNINASSTLRARVTPGAEAASTALAE